MTDLKVLIFGAISIETSQISNKYRNRSLWWFDRGIDM